ncbi:MAG: putative tail tubular protein [Prokaryotic dsDNA virus sp.]|nr:MAG: putative tail tubular protein [Prokaryotic dsDNA virus sp.]|tara:strand:+ start:4700 stop:5281 length:582 start_codon:yes stop_codon:yes gene_type:complete
MATLTSQLESVNAMLGHIGESPVSTLTGSLPVSATTALSTLNEVSKEIQTEGWHFNSEKDVTLSPVAGTITVPTNAVQVDADDKRVDVVQRGSVLFDRANNTSTFTESIKVNLIRLLDWDDLPEEARRYITLRASRIFQGRVVGSRELEALIARDEYQARSRLEESDYGSSDRTIFDNFDAATRIGVNRNYDI